MKRLIYLFALAALAAPLAFASGTSGGGSPAGAVPGSERPFAVTETLKCRILKVYDGGNALRVLDERSHKEHVVQITEAAKIKAQDKRSFDGRKKLTPSDLEVGQRIQITLRQDNMEVLRVKVLKT